MSMTTTQSPTESRFDWRPSAREVEAIVAEMRPVIAALAADGCRRLHLSPPPQSSALSGREYGCELRRHAEDTRRTQTRAVAPPTRTLQAARAMMLTGSYACVACVVAQTVLPDGNGRVPQRSASDATTRSPLPPGPV